MTIPFQKPMAQPQGGYVLGQPFTVKSLGIPINIVFTCNCIGEGITELIIDKSTQVLCPHCETRYNAFWNPQTGGVQFSVQKPTKEPIPA